MRFRISFLFCCVAVLLQGCAVGPNHQAPASPELDPKFAGAANPAELKTDSPWWKDLGDPVLNGLVEEAVTQNLDLAIATERILEARALRREARAALFPSINGRADYTDVGISETQNAAVNPIVAFGGAIPNRAESWTTGLDASWEVDVFGGNRRRTEAAKAREAALSEAAHGTRLALIAEAVDSYYTIAGLRAQLDRVQANISRQKETADIVAKLQAEGLRSELDLRRANAQLATTQAEAPGLRASITGQLRRLSLLLGKKPGYLDERMGTFRGFPDRLPIARMGLPAELIMRRPDLRQAERNLAAATADIGVATSAFYPRFILFGSPELTSGSSADLFNINSLAWRAGPRIEWSIFNSGANRALVQAANSRQKQAFLSFEGAVLKAVGEVETTLAQMEGESQRLNFLQRAVRESRASVSLAEKLYREGLQDLVAVLVEQERLIATELDEAGSQTALISSWVSLHKALGGGWE